MQKSLAGLDLKKESKDAFYELEGKRWYITGDLGYMDDAGNLVLAGRLKRFVKIGGEMISIPAMEAAIQEVYPNEEGEPRIAITFIEREGERPVLCYFSTVESSVEDANRILKEAGFSNLARVSKYLKLDEIPKLGTGKTDYQTLKKMLQDLLATA